MPYEDDISISAIPRSEALKRGVFRDDAETRRSRRWGQIHNQIDALVTTSDKSGSPPDVLDIEVSNTDAKVTRRIVQTIRNYVERRFGNWRPHVRVIVGDDRTHIYVLMERITEPPTEIVR